MLVFQLRLQLFLLHCSQHLTLLLQSSLHFSLQFVETHAVKLPPSAQRMPTLNLFLFRKRPSAAAEVTLLLKTVEANDSPSFQWLLARFVPLREEEPTPLDRTLRVETDAASPTLRKCHFFAVSTPSQGCLRSKTGWKRFPVVEASPVNQSLGPVNFDWNQESVLSETDLTKRKQFS